MSGTPCSKWSSPGMFKSFVRRSIKWFLLTELQVIKSCKALVLSLHLIFWLLFAYEQNGKAKKNQIFLNVLPFRGFGRNPKMWELCWNVFQTITGMEVFGKEYKERSSVREKLMTFLVIGTVSSEFGFCVVFLCMSKNLNYAYSLVPDEWRNVGTFTLF